MYSINWCEWLLERRRRNILSIVFWDAFFTIRRPIEVGVVAHTIVYHHPFTLNPGAFIKSYTLCVAEPCEFKYVYVYPKWKPFDRTLSLNMYRMRFKCICKTLSLLTVQQLFTYVTWWILARSLFTWITCRPYHLIYHFN